MEITHHELSQRLKDFIASKDRSVFLEHEVKGFLKELGFAVPKGFFVPAGTAGDLTLPEGMVYPLVAKVSSTRIASKSDVKGVRIGIENGNEMRSAASGLLEIRDAQGVLIEEKAAEGVEVIIGGILDAQFGPIVMFGLGGVFVEVFKDVAFALAPVNKDTALWLVRQVKGSRLLEGYRGRPASDLDELLRIIVDVSELIGTGLLREIDLNPVALYPQGAMVLDAKMFAVTPSGYR